MGEELHLAGALPLGAEDAWLRTSLDFVTILGEMPGEAATSLREIIANHLTVAVVEYQRTRGWWLLRAVESFIRA